MNNLQIINVGNGCKQYFIFVMNAFAYILYILYQADLVGSDYTKHLNSYLPKHTFNNKM